MRRDTERPPANDAEKVAKGLSMVSLIWEAMKRIKRKITPVLIIPENGGPKIMSEYSADERDRLVAANTGMSQEKLAPVGVEHTESEIGAGVPQEGSLYADNYRLIPAQSTNDESEYEPEIDQAAPTGEVSPEDAARLLESRRFVRTAPRLTDQLADEETRSNLITYIAETHSSLKTVTSKDRYRDNRAELTEYETLRQLEEFLDYIESLNGECAAKAKSMRENLTFIGEKEYKEAAAGIAASWKAALEANTDLQICTIAGEIGREKIKSGEYLLDNILADFTEEDWKKYGGRIIVDRDDIAQVQQKKENLRVVFLDDWTISGMQLKNVYNLLVEQYPEIKDRIEVQLIVANKQRIEKGFLIDRWMGDEKRIPLRAYFSAHEAKTAENGAYITGFHSSVDYDFETLIRRMLREVEYREDRPELKGKVSMPPGTNIVRPYRKDGVTRANLTNIKRARQYRRGRLAIEQGDNHAIL